MATAPAGFTGSVLLTDADLAGLQARIAAEEPRALAYSQALAQAVPFWHEGDSQAPATFKVPPFYQDTAGHRAQKTMLLQDATAAYGLALHYRLTGDEVDAVHAVRFLRPWFRDVSFIKDSETSLVVSYTFPIMIYAADLLRTAPLNVWTQEDRDDFDTFLNETVLGFNTASSTNNWGDWGNLLRISIAAYRDDAALFALCIARHKELIRDQIGENHEFTLEVTRNGGLGEQGISYSHFSLGPLATVAQIALNHGIDVFDYIAPNGRSMEPAWRQLVAWTANPASFPYFTGADISQMANVTTTDFDYFHQADTQLFPIRMGYFELLQARWPEPAAAEVIANVGAGGLDVTGMQWLGLTHSAPVVAGTPLDVTQINASVNSPARITLTWAHPGTDVAGFNIERRIPGDEWALLAVVPADTRNLIDGGLAPGSTWEYRIRAFSPAGPAPFWTGPARATTAMPTTSDASDALLTETFSDLERSSQNLPTSAAWYFGTQAAGASIDASSGSLVLTEPPSHTSTLTATAYFTDSIPCSLALGESMELSFSLRTRQQGSSIAEGLRFGLYNSDGNRLLTDVGTNNGDDSAYLGWRGYSVFTTLGASTSGALSVNRRSAATSGTIMAAAAHTLVAPSTTAPALASNILYPANTLRITRTENGTTISGTIAGTDFTVEDSSPAALASFDAISFWVHNRPLGGSGQLDLDNIILRVLKPLNIAGGITISQTGTGQTRLDWLPPQSIPAGYRLERALIGGPFLLLADLDGTVLTALDRHATPGSDYVYRLTPYDEFGTGIAATASVSTDTPLEAWRRKHFGSAQSNELTADTADPDSDGVVNLLEYALGGDPLTADANILPKTSTVQINGSPHLTLSFLRARHNVVYTVQCSNNLIDWSPLPPTSGPIGTVVTVIDPEPISAVFPRRFLRLHVSMSL